MQVISTIAGLRARLAGETAIAFVPTMGNLHEGHLDLVRTARGHGKCVVLSIFVNPLQFGPGEDFDRYPRTLEADCAKLQELADVVFAPSASEMYPVQQTVFIDLPPIAGELCGAARPGHFRGMATVVLKLLNIVQPQVALFGKKDYQQLHIIRLMVGQLNLPVRIIGGETVRAADGLALSSRNGYLDPGERARAVGLSQALARVRDAWNTAAPDAAAIEAAAMAALRDGGWLPDYVCIRRQADLAVPTLQDRADGVPVVVLAAARIGSTRLIDNIEVSVAARQR